MIDLTNLKSAFHSNYQSPYVERKPKTKVKLSHLKTAQSKPPEKVDCSNEGLASLGVHLQSHIPSTCQKENELTPPSGPSRQHDLKSRLRKSRVSSTYTFFSECQHLEKCKYSGARQSDHIKEKLKNQFLKGVFDDQAIGDAEERSGKMKWKLSNSNHPEKLTGVKSKRGKATGAECILGEFIEEKRPKFLAKKSCEYQRLKIDLTCDYELNGLRIEDYQ